MGSNHEVLNTSSFSEKSKGKSSNVDALCLLGIFITLFLVSSGCLGSENFDKTVTIAVDDYYVKSFKGLKEIEWEVEYLSGDTKIDILFLNVTNYEKYQNDENFTHFEELSKVNVTNAHRGPMLVDDFDCHLVFDNTDKGVAKPPEDDNDHSVKIKIEITYKSDD